MIGLEQTTLAPLPRRPHSTAQKELFSSTVVP
jgi:hypothetical protein